MSKFQDNHFYELNAARYLPSEDYYPDLDIHSNSDSTLG
jgi:hypothetical protein